MEIQKDQGAKVYQGPSKPNEPCIIKASLKPQGSTEYADEGYKYLCDTRFVCVLHKKIKTDFWGSIFRIFLVSIEAAIRAQRPEIETAKHPKIAKISQAQKVWAMVSDETESLSRIHLRIVVPGAAL